MRERSLCMHRGERWEHNEKAAVHKPGRESSPKIKVDLGHIDHGLLDSTTVIRESSVVYVCGILLWQPRQTKLIYSPTHVSYCKAFIQYSPA